MAQDTDLMAAAGESLKGFFDMQGEAMREMMSGKGAESLMAKGVDAGELAEWAATATQLQQLWFDFATHQRRRRRRRLRQAATCLIPRSGW